MCSCFQHMFFLWLRQPVVFLSSCRKCDSTSHLWDNGIVISILFDRTFGKCHSSLCKIKLVASQKKHPEFLFWRSWYLFHDHIGFLWVFQSQPAYYIIWRFSVALQGVRTWILHLTQISYYRKYQNITKMANK